MSSSITASGTPSRVVTGRVVDAATKEPIPGALVHASGHLHRARAGENGEFELRRVGEDALAVIAGAPGYTMRWQPLETSWHDLLFELRPETSETVPHPDYPRPDFDRRPGSGWATLNGTWRFAFDPDNRGLREGWATGTDYPHLVVVPFSYCSLAGLGEQARASNSVYASQFAPRRGVVWYWREFTVPADFDPRRHTLLRLGAVEWHSTVFLDGRQLSKHDGGYTPFDADLGVLAPGSKHAVAVRVVVPDNSDRTPYPQGKQTSWYTDNGGIWQSVWLEQADPVRLRTLHVTPELEFNGTEVTAAVIAVRVRAEHASEVRLRVRAQQEPPGPAQPDEPAGFPLPREPVMGAVVAQRTVSFVGNETVLRIAIPEPQLWDPERPWLYRLEAEATGKPGRDEVHTWFGLRSITRAWAPGHAPSEQDDVTEQYQYLMLNNRPIQLRSVLDQAFNPWGNYSYTGLYQDQHGQGSISVPRKGSVLFDLALTKQLGFNSARLHIKVNDPLYYHWADLLGVLVFYDLPNFGYRGFSPTAEQLFESVLTDAVHRDFNHPSIVIWDVINEAWGVGGGWAQLAITEHTKPWIERMVARTRELLGDTRLVVDNSPCCNNFHPTEDTDLLDFHGYYSTWEEWAKVLDDYVSSTYPGSTHNMEPGKRQHGQPLLNSEYGPWSGGAEMDQEVATPFRYTTELFRSRSKMAGYLFTELTDLEWEWNGWAAYDRTLEVPGYLDAAGRQAGVPLANADDVLLVSGPPAWRVDPGERVELPVLASLFSHAPDTEFTLRWRVTGTDRTGAALAMSRWQRRTVHGKRYTVTGLGTVPVTVPDGLVCGRVMLELLCANDVVATGQATLLSGAGGLHEHEVALDPAAAIQVWPMGKQVLHTGAASAAIGYGDGAFHWELPVPDALAEANSVQLLLEASAQRPDLPRTRFPQTSERRYPSTLTATVDGAGSRTVRLPDAPADARGVFSHAAGFDPGRYGYRVLLDFAADQVRAAVKDGVLRVSLAGSGGGLAMFGAGTGRFGITPRLVFGAEPLPGAEIQHNEPYVSTADGAGISTYLSPGRPALGTAGRMMLTVVNDSTRTITGVQPVLLGPPGFPVRPDVEAHSGFTLAPGESCVARYTVTPADTRLVILRTKAHYDGIDGRQVVQRDWVVPISAR